MSTNTIKTAAAATAIALFSSAAPAAAQTAPNLELSLDLRTIAVSLGDQDGHLSVIDAAGGLEVLARGQGRFVVYTAGDEVNYGDTFAFCTVDSAAQLSSCEPLDLSAGSGGANEFKCEYYPGDGWCECSSVLDCVHMALSGVCTDDITCDGDGCACANW